MTDEVNNVAPVINNVMLLVESLRVDDAFMNNWAMLLVQADIMHKYISTFVILN